MYRQTLDVQLLLWRAVFQAINMQSQKWQTLQTEERDAIAQILVRDIDGISSEVKQYLQLLTMVDASDEDIKVYRKKAEGLSAIAHSYYFKHIQQGEAWTHHD